MRSLPYVCHAPATHEPPRELPVHADPSRGYEVMSWSLKPDCKLVVRDSSGKEWAQVLPFVPSGVWRMYASGGIVVVGSKWGASRKERSQTVATSFCHPLDPPARVCVRGQGAASEFTSLATLQIIHHDWYSGFSVWFDRKSRKHVVLRLQQTGSADSSPGGHPKLQGDGATGAAEGSGSAIKSAALSRESSRGTMVSAATSHSHGDAQEGGALLFGSPRLVDRVRESLADRKLLAGSPSALSSILRSGGGRTGRGRLSLEGTVGASARRDRLVGVPEGGRAYVSPRVTSAVGRAAAGVAGGRRSIGGRKTSAGEAGLDPTASAAAVVSGEQPVRRKGFGAGGRMLSAEFEMPFRGQLAGLGKEQQHSGGGTTKAGARSRALPTIESLGIVARNPAQYGSTGLSGAGASQSSVDAGVWEVVGGMGRRKGPWLEVVCHDVSALWGEVPGVAAAVHSSVNSDDAACITCLVGGGSGTAEVCGLRDAYAKSSEQGARLQLLCSVPSVSCLDSATSVSFGRLLGDERSSTFRLLSVCYCDTDEAGKAGSELQGLVRALAGHVPIRSGRVGSRGLVATFGGQHLEHWGRTVGIGCSSTSSRDVAMETGVLLLPGSSAQQQLLSSILDLLDPASGSRVLQAIDTLAAGLDRRNASPTDDVVVKVDCGTAEQGRVGDVVLRAGAGPSLSVTATAAVLDALAAFHSAARREGSPKGSGSHLGAKGGVDVSGPMKLGVRLLLGPSQAATACCVLQACTYALGEEESRRALLVDTISLQRVRLVSEAGLEVQACTDLGSLFARNDLQPVAVESPSGDSEEQFARRVLATTSRTQAWTGRFQDVLPSAAIQEISPFSAGAAMGSTRLHPAVSSVQLICKGVEACPPLQAASLPAYSNESQPFVAYDSASLPMQDISSSSLARWSEFCREIARIACREYPPARLGATQLQQLGRHDLAYVQYLGMGAGGSGHASVFPECRPVAVGFTVSTGQVESELGPATLGTNDEHLNEIVRYQGFLSAGSSGDSRDVDGLTSLADLMQLRFPDDRRASIVAQQLQSSRAQPIVLGESDLTTLAQDPSADIAYLRQTRLLLMARRTCAAVAGRGCLTIGTLIPATSSGIVVPPIVMHGVTRSGKKIVIDFSGVASVQYSITDLPEFLNGFAAAIRLYPAGLPTSMRREWVLRHVPHEASYSAGGVLMALGVHGLLHSLAAADLFEVLYRRHIGLTSGVLLGLSAGARGAQDPMISKAVCLHIPAILPELYQDVSLQPMVQTCALLSLGMTFEGTCHKVMAQFCLDEIGQDCRAKPLYGNEGYSLAAGIALGFIGLARGAQPTGLQEIPLVAKLRTLAWGGTDDELNRAAHARIDAPDVVLRQPRIRMHLTAAPAVVALGLLYMRTGLPAAAEALKLPDSVESLRPVRPDVALLRVTSHALVCWDDVEPTLDWVKQQVPWGVRCVMATRKRVEENTLAQQGGAGGGLAAVLALADGDSGDEDSDDDLCDPSYAAAAAGSSGEEGAVGGASERLSGSSRTSDLMAEQQRLAKLKEVLRARRSRLHEQTGFADGRDFPFKGPSVDAADLALLDERACREIHAYCLGGAALALGLRYAGSSNHEARDTLLQLMLHFESIRVKDEKDLLAMRAAMALPHGQIIRKQRRKRGLRHIVRSVGSEGETVIENDLAAAPDGMPETWEGKVPSFRALARIRSQHSLVETCRGCVVMALGMVMAGTGDVDSMRCLRAARFKLSRGMDYGHHIAQQLGLGMLFLGASRCSLSSSPDAVAMLYTAAMPYFPYGSGDSRFHPQPARALWACAADRRSLDLVDSRSGDAVRAGIVLSVVSGRKGSGTRDPPPCCHGLQPIETPAEALRKCQDAGLEVQSFRTTTPVILPPLYLIAGIQVDDPRYYRLNLFPRFSELHANALLAADLASSARTEVHTRQRCVAGQIVGTGQANDPALDVRSTAFGEPLASGAPAVLCWPCISGCSLLVEKRLVRLDYAGILAATEAVAQAASTRVAARLDDGTRETASGATALPGAGLAIQQSADLYALDLLFGDPDEEVYEAASGAGSSGAAALSEPSPLHGFASPLPQHAKEIVAAARANTGYRGHAEEFLTAAASAAVISRDEAESIPASSGALEGEAAVLRSLVAAGLPSLGHAATAVVGAGEHGYLVHALHARAAVAASRAASSGGYEDGDRRREGAVGGACRLAAACLETAGVKDPGTGSGGGTVAGDSIIERAVAGGLESLDAFAELAAM